MTVNNNNSKLVSCSLFAHKKLRESLKHINKQIYQLEQELVSLIAKSALKKKMEVITSIKGVGPITALELILITGNFKKLTTAKKAAAYAGSVHIRTRVGTLDINPGYILGLIKN